MVSSLIQKTQGHGTINTAFIERLNATFRQRLNSLARRTRTIVHKAETLEAGMYVVGCMYNFCDPHHSLRLKLSVGRFGHHWVQRTPAIAAYLTDHIWTPSDYSTSECHHLVGNRLNNGDGALNKCKNSLICGALDHV